MEPTSGKTIRLEEHYKLSNERADEVRAASRKNYAKKYEEPKTERSVEKSVVTTTRRSAIKQPGAANKLKGKSIGSK